MSLIEKCQGYLCPTCGCSLVRLGIDPLSAPSTIYQVQEYRFCCEGCVTSFLKNPELYLEEIKDMVICPTCLGEKPRGQTLCINIDGESIYFCRCPCCIDDFQKSPESLEMLIQKRPKS